MLDYRHLLYFETRTCESVVSSRHGVAGDFVENNCV